MTPQLQLAAEAEDHFAEAAGHGYRGALGGHHYDKHYTTGVAGVASAVVDQRGTVGTARRSAGLDARNEWCATVMRFAIILVLSIDSETLHVDLP